MEQQRMFEGAPEAVILSCHYRIGEGWTARVQVRRQFEDWEEARTTTYDRLSTSELGDVLEAMTAEIWSALGL